MCRINTRVRCLRIFFFSRIFRSYVRRVAVGRCGCRFERKTKQRSICKQRRKPQAHWMAQRTHCVSWLWSRWRSVLLLYCRFMLMMMMMTMTMFSKIVKIMAKSNGWEGRAATCFFGLILYIFLEIYFLFCFTFSAGKILLHSIVRSFGRLVTFCMSIGARGGTIFAIVETIRNGAANPKSRSTCNRILRLRSTNERRYIVQWTWILDTTQYECACF